MAIIPTEPLKDTIEFDDLTAELTIDEVMEKLEDVPEIKDKIIEHFEIGVNDILSTDEEFKSIEEKENLNEYKVKYEGIFKGRSAIISFCAKFQDFKQKELTKKPVCAESST